LANFWSPTSTLLWFRAKYCSVGLSWYTVFPSPYYNKPQFQISRNSTFCIWTWTEIRPRNPCDCGYHLSITRSSQVHKKKQKQDLDLMNT
jgi:hypothetical protein